MPNVLDRNVDKSSLDHVSDYDPIYNPKLKSYKVAVCPDPGFIHSSDPAANLECNLHTNDNLTRTKVQRINPFYPDSLNKTYPLDRSIKMGWNNPDLCRCDF